MWQLPSQPFGIGRALINSFKLWGVSLGRLLPFSLLFLIWTVLPAFFVEVSPRDIGFYISMFQRVDPVIAVLLFAAIFIIFYGILSIFYGALCFRLQQFITGQTASFSSALNVGLKKMPALLLAMIMVLVTLGVGTVLLVIPVLFFYMVLQFCFPLLVIEDISPWAAYKKCFHLVWGSWWYVAIVSLIIAFFFMVMMGLVFSGLEIMLGEPISYDVLVGALQTPLSTRTFHEFLSMTVTEIVVGSLLFPLLVSMLFVLLHNLRLRLAQRSETQQQQ